ARAHAPAELLALAPRFRGVGVGNGLGKGKPFGNGRAQGASMGGDPRSVNAPSLVRGGSAKYIAPGRQTFCAGNGDRLHLAEETTYRVNGISKRVHGIVV